MCKDCPGAMEKFPSCLCSVADPNRIFVGQAWLASFLVEGCLRLEKGLGQEARERGLGQEATEPGPLES